MSDAGTYPCGRPRCLTCKHTTPRTTVQGPKSVYTIRDRFTCQSANVVYCIVCRRCSVLYIGETGRRLRQRFSEHLRSIRNHSPGFPVAEHFNSPSHSLDDITVCGLKQCSGGNTSRKQQEMRLIFEVGSLRPSGLNINFSFLWLILRVLVTCNIVFFSTSIYKKSTVLISRALIMCAREPLVFVWRNSRFNIGISDYNTEEGLSPKRLLTFSFLTLKRVFLIFLLKIIVLEYAMKSPFPPPLPLEGTWVIFCWVCTGGFSEAIIAYYFFCEL